MTQMLFYENITPLDKNVHRDMAIIERIPFDFARKINSVPIVGFEMKEAVKYYPTLFAVDENGNHSLVALLGLEDNRNLYVSEEGNWTVPYVPAFVRRYPFVPARGQNQDEIMICFDDQSGLLKTEGGARLFDEQGEPTERLNMVTELLRDYQFQADRTNEFIKRLIESELLIERSIQLRMVNGREVHINGLKIIDEEKLRSLSEAKAMEFLRSGELGLIYFHLASLGNLLQLGERMGASAAVAAESAEGAVH